MAATNGKFILSNSILGAALTAGAKSAVLQSKLKASRVWVTGFSATGTSNVVTTVVTAAATTLTPIAALTAKGVYTGTISGAADQKKVLIRANGTDNGINDGTGDDVYGVLSEATGAYTLTYKTAAGASFTMPASTISFSFVEVFDLYTLPVDAALGDAIGGVIDASTASALNSHINNGTGAHADTAILSAFSGTHYMDARVNVHNALIALDSAINAIPAAVVDFGADVFRIHDASTITKKIAFSAVSITAVNTRTITMPDHDVDLQFVRKTYTVVTAALVTGDITAKYIDLAVGKDLIDAVNTTIVNPVGGVRQLYTVDYTIITDGTFVQRINWSGLGLESMLEAGDKLQITFQCNS